MTQELRTVLDARFCAVEEQVLAACQRAGRARSSVTVVAVAKKQPAEALRAYVAWCHERSLPCCIGENYVQELQEHRAVVPAAVPFHFIGRIQRNKVAALLQQELVVQSVDRQELLQALHNGATALGRKVPVHLQVNISKDPAKGGFLPGDLKGVFSRLSQFSALEVRGLMAITRLYADPEYVRPDFQQMRVLRDEFGGALDLSIGMSQDFGIAIEEGATLVRIGTALFGQRH